MTEERGRELERKERWKDGRKKGRIERNKRKEGRPERKVQEHGKKEEGG